MPRESRRQRLQRERQQQREANRSLAEQVRHPHKAELVFRHKLLRLLRDRDLISEERIDLLLSWKHSGMRFHQCTQCGFCHRV